MRILLAVCVIVATIVACGGDSGPQLSELAAEGREIAQSRGCAACHGQEGEGDIGPPWVGLAGATVQLDGGESVVADSLYLRRAIVDPDAEVVAGVSISMPVTNLSDREVDALIAYIEEL